MGFSQPQLDLLHRGDCCTTSARSVSPRDPGQARTARSGGVSSHAGAPQLGARILEPISAYAEVIPWSDSTTSGSTGKAIRKDWRGGDLAGGSHLRRRRCLRCDPVGPALPGRNAAGPGDGHHPEGERSAVRSAGGGGLPRVMAEDGPRQEAADQVGQRPDGRPDPPGVGTPGWRSCRKASDMTMRPRIGITSWHRNDRDGLERWEAIRTTYTGAVLAAAGCR